MIVCSDIELSFTLSFSCNPGRGQLQQTIASIFVLTRFTIVLPISELKRLLVVLTISPTLLYITSLCLLSHSFNCSLVFLFPFSLPMLVCMSFYSLFYFFLSLMVAILYSQISDGSFYKVYALLLLLVLLLLLLVVVLLLLVLLLVLLFKLYYFIKYRHK